jgi:predicted LPLAT superfamily acyltransferase
MKKIIITLAILIIAAVSSFAQNKPSTTGSWVIESNVKQPKVQTVKFYNNDNQLLYSETVNKRLNINRKKIRQNLDKVLDSLISKNDYAQNQAILAAIFKLKK